MRRPLGSLLTLVLLALAGCSDSKDGGGGDPTPTPTPTPGGPTPPAPAPPPPAAPVEQEFFRETLDVNTVQPASFQATVPAGSTNVTFHLTVTRAAGQDLEVELAGCGSFTFYAGETVTALGGEVDSGVVCAVATEGDQDVSVTIATGVFQGELAMSALVAVT